MAITKLLLLLVVVTAQLYATTAPNVRPPTEQLREQRGSEHAVPYLTAFLRILISSWAFIEASVLFALSDYCPPVLAHPLLNALTGTPDLSPTSLTPAFLAGTLLSLTGALLRAHCFHTLGPHFTFELSIRPSHALVTKGIYGVVRHPSYTGGVALAVGWLLCVLDRRGWLVGACTRRWAASGEGGGNAMVTGVLACVWAMALSVMYVLGNERMNKEDAMLEENFGEEWRAWAKRVPCRLVPGIY